MQPQKLIMARKVTSLSFFALVQVSRQQRCETDEHHSIKGDVINHECGALKVADCCVRCASLSGCEASDLSLGCCTYYTHVHHSKHHNKSATAVTFEPTPKPTPVPTPTPPTPHPTPVPTLPPAPPAPPGQSYRPVVMMHGMNEHASHVQRNMDALRQRYPGIYVTSLAVYEGISSMLTGMEPQLDAITKAIQNNSRLVNGFNFYGESQGALLARSFVSSVNKPPVYNLVALNGPQAGVGECPKIEVPLIKTLCGTLGTDLDIYHWPFCSFCQFWKGRNKSLYLENNEWLAYINGDRKTNPEHRQNMVSLNKYMATYATKDTVVQPPQSAWHTYWHWNDPWRSSVMQLNETEGFQNDTLGLKSLHERGDLILNYYDGDHLKYNMSWWDENVLPMFDNFVADVVTNVIV